MANDPRQRDWITEAGDSPMLKSASMADVLQRLPIMDFLKVSDVTSALNIHEGAVYAWIEEGKFEVMNLGAGKKPYYNINRKSFLKFLETRIV